ncbi:CLUMA_CG014148, isoform B [Clunio marinus]|uniref:CLUMA_CG014148, isoform B n=1 Tax=Clunio marinus TaxID=568069 RepID=A0A1J1IMD3_9DIPT|nr:CLUMA_CG014148, isoform B [Clunio marinus]
MSYHSHRTSKKEKKQARYTSFEGRGRALNTMEYSNFYIRSSSIKSSFNHNKRFLRSANLIREYRDYPFYDHVKRNIKGANVNSETNSENDNANNLITYEHSSSESWLDLVLPFTILGITILGVVLIGVILFIWIRKYFSETNEKSQESARLECEKEKKYKEKLNRRMMNSRKWLKGKNKKVNNQAVDDLEQKLENIEHKSSPPTSPNFQKQNEDVASLSSDDSDSECVGNVIKKHDDDDNADNKSPKSNPIILPCPLAISDFSSVASLVHPQPCGQTNESQVQQIKSSSTSSLSFLQEEVHCIQPREDQTSKIYKSIATSPPPFSPIVHQHTSQTYATQGTQTYFTKAPNSPNNHLLSSSFAVVQTPTTSTIPSGNPFLTPSSPSSYNNKENKEPSVGRLRNTCLNKSISNFKQDNGASTATTTTTTSLPSSPSSVLSTSPKLNTNVLQPQNSPIIQQQQQQSSSGESPPPSINRQFNFSPKIQSNNSPTISSANYNNNNNF